MKTNPSFSNKSYRVVSCSAYSHRLHRLHHDHRFRLLSTVDHRFRSADLVFRRRSFARTLFSAFSTYSLQIGFGLIGFGIFFSFLGIIFFDKGLLAIGNMLCFWSVLNHSTEINYVILHETRVISSSIPNSGFCCYGVLEALWQNYFLPASRHGFGLASVGKVADVAYTDGIGFIMYKHTVQKLGIITPFTTFEMGVLNQLGPIGKGDKWVNFQTRAGRPCLVLELLFTLVEESVQGQPEADMVECTSKSTPDLAKGRGYSDNKTMMHRKKARETPSQEYCFSPPHFEATKGDVEVFRNDATSQSSGEESLRGRPEAGEEEAMNQSTLCEGWSLMGIKLDPEVP
ncbi:vesicle transport protein GOT1 [Senna tora]|uniref:Vesicle transport protein GOT1 n=1 Tax=Senna tora TaxID=362788 RepID=A0A834TFP0_9FABA|nr:vesicle transport protein GOT1 [Senna tora]